MTLLLGNRTDIYPLNGCLFYLLRTVTEGEVLKQGVRCSYKSNNNLHE